jgi:hypothetical protein
VSKIHGYDFTHERKQLLNIMNDISKSRKKISEFNKSCEKKEEELTAIITQQRETIENLHVREWEMAHLISFDTRSNSLLPFSHSLFVFHGIQNHTHIAVVVTNIYSYFQKKTHTNIYIYTYIYLNYKQKKAFGFAAPVSSSFTYRIPESHLLMNLKSQYGRTELELSCLPDPKLTMLGPRGFVKGVSPLNLGLSCTISM